MRCGFLPPHLAETMILDVTAIKMFTVFCLKGKWRRMVWGKIMPAREEVLGDVRTIKKINFIGEKRS